LIIVESFLEDKMQNLDHDSYFQEVILTLIKR